MRLLVHGRSLAGTTRMRMAVCGLARRGHRVLWLGAGAPHSEPDLHVVAGRHEVVRLGEQVDLVLGSSRRPWATGWTAWRLAARGRVLSVEAPDQEHTAWPDRWAYEAVRTAWIGPGLAAGSHALAFSWSATSEPSSPEAAHPDTEVLERACEAALAHAIGGPRPAAFVDRDGTLVVEKEYLSDPEDLELIAGSARAIAQLQAAGYAVVLISNQSGVARGLFTLERVHAVMARLRLILRHAGVELDGVYVCPHAPEDGCPCRKPGTGLLREAARTHNLTLSRSVMIGDKLIDVQAGQTVGGRGILVRTGYGRSEEERARDLTRPPEHVAEDLGEAAAWLIEHGPVRE